MDELQETTWREENGRFILMEPMFHQNSGAFEGYEDFELPGGLVALIQERAA